MTPTLEMQMPDASRYACSLSELCEKAGLALPTNIDGTHRVTGIEDDSRRVQAGNVFVAVRGTAVDGHSYMAAALEAGAVVVAEQIPPDLAPELLQDLADAVGTRPADLVKMRAENTEVLGAGRVMLVADTRVWLGQLAHAFYGFPARRLCVVGITGTNGKTTTAYLVEGALRKLRRYPGLISTVEYRLGDISGAASQTTPGALVLARMMALALERDADSIVMEVSSHALAQRRVEGITFDVATISNVTQDHLDYHKTIEEYAATKQLLFSRYAPRFGVFNLDDATSKRFAEGFEGSVLTYSLDSESDADVVARDLRLDAEGTSLLADFRRDDRQVPITSPLRGRFNASNLLAAACVLKGMGVQPEQIAVALRGTKGAPGRFESIDLGQKFQVFVDYAHTPDAVERVLENVRYLTTGKLIVVLGCGGDRDAGKRPLMGAAMGRLADFSIITNDNPRTEDPAQIASQMEEGMREVAGAEAYKVCLDRAEAIRLALGRARDGDSVVIAGKGHEDYQVIGDTTHHFDDCETAREMLRKVLKERRERN